MRSFDPEVVEQFWKNVWKPNPLFNEEVTNDLFPVKKFFDKEMNEQMIMEILNKGKLMERIKKKRKSISYRFRWDYVSICESRKRNSCSTYYVDDSDNYFSRKNS
jgi:hypothetical protein